jgi:hypothetical protein
LFASPVRHLVWYTGCFKKSFTVVFRIFVCSECYENFYAWRRTNYL